jgi:signal transduction histidine kinase
MRIPHDGASLNSAVAESQQALIVDDVTQDSRYLAMQCLPDTRSELVVPLLVGNRTIGTLDVQSSKLDAFGAEELRVLQSLGDQVAVAIENAGLYHRSRELAVLEERGRLARDLHDSVIQALYSLNLLAEGWRRSAGSGQDGNVEKFDRIGEIAHQALKEMRLLVYELQPMPLKQEGLLGALHQRLGAVENRSGVEARLVAEDLVDFPLEVEEGLYRIALEALNNALKHSEGTKVTVRLEAMKEEVTLQVMDNGCGFDADSPAFQGGMGLTSMRQRVEELGGSLSIESSPGRGTTVKATVRFAAPGDHWGRIRYHGSSEGVA